MSDPRTALAWCSRDDYGWCGRHNRPFAHCEAEAKDTLAAVLRELREDWQIVRGTVPSVVVGPVTAATIAAAQRIDRRLA